MRKFVNNWLHELIDVLPEGSTSLPLPAGAETALGLADGDSVVLTATSSMQPIEQTAWEFILLERDGGVTTVTRGALGTDDQEWPAGSPIYASLPAEQMAEWHAAIADLQARVTALEAGGGGADEGYSTSDSLVYADNISPTGVTVHWTPATAPAIEVGPAIDSGEVNMRWLLVTPSLMTLTLQWFLDDIYANCPVTDIGDSFYEVALPALACWVTLRRCYAGPWILLVEPLQTPTV